MARQIVRHFKPTGRLLDPCRGTSRAFYDALCEAGPTEWCEITENRNFFAETRHFDWIITNPPWSQLRQFLLHAMTLADHIVFLVTLTHMDTRARDREIHGNGFGRREALLVKHPPPPWPASGFLLSAYHLERGYTGPLYFDRHLIDPPLDGFIRRRMPLPS